MAELDNNSPALPFVRAGGNEINLDRAFTRYDVYVNDEFVGHKKLLKQAESIDDVGNFLHRENFKGFTTEYDENHLHYKIYVDNDSTARAIRGQLTNYLSRQ
ncbi:hypothetical protein [Alicyclobacillus dauci]|uniref:Uncharacterized protein n=1 Tax=Alicyclobacillus dauci TaxID=1475485 RepID=A0ABY6Z2A8_9BACL|nr:hypothetical protein [Alicyclobacillus dauci]WAH36456.1 hypothetical protein NZD86_19905 [Alicyclobacillus dauci]